MCISIKNNAEFIRESLVRSVRLNILPVSTFKLTYDLIYHCCGLKFSVKDLRTTKDEVLEKIQNLKKIYRVRGYRTADLQIDSQTQSKS